MRMEQPRLLLQLLLPVASLTLAHPLAVVLIEFVFLDDGYQAVGIRGVGSITRLLQAACPAAVVGYLQVEEEGVACPPPQEERVVGVRLGRRAVGTETFVAGIVVVTHAASPPSAAALDAEVVVAFACQRAASGSALQQSLCQGDAGRNLVLPHLLHRQRGVLPDVFVVQGVAALSLHARGQ